MQAWEGQQQTLKGIVWLRYRCMNAAIIVMYSHCSAFPFPIEDPPKTFSRQFQLTQSPALGNSDIRLLSFKARKTFIGNSDAIPEKRTSSSVTKDN